MTINLVDKWCGTLKAISAKTVKIKVGFDFPKKYMTGIDLVV